MAYFGSVVISDREGWEKVYPLEKALVMVGSAPVNDIVLPDLRGSGVASLHIQVIQPQAGLGQVRVVNLAKEGVPFRRSSGAENGAIPPGSSLMVGNGDEINLGDFTLQFALQAQAGMMRTARSAHLGLKLDLPGLSLSAGGRLAGMVTVTNYGDQRRCQFELELEGIPDGCYQIDPAPLLFPGAEECLQIRIFHRGSCPLAGRQPFTLRASAPAAYPTEVVAISETLDVSPVYCFELAVQDPASGVETAAPQPVSLNAWRIEPVQPETRSAIEPLLRPTALSAASPEVPPAPAGEPEAPAVEPAPPAEPDWYPAEGKSAPGQPPRGTVPGRLPGGRRPVLTRSGSPIPVIKAGPEPEPGEDAPAGEGKTP